MSKLSSLTENKYTLRDIFVRNHEVWLAIPLFCYLLTPVVHMIVFALNFSDNTDDFNKIIHTINTGEKIGDYYTEIIFLFTVVAAIIALIALISHLFFAKKVMLKKSADIVPLLFFAMLCSLIVVSTITNRTEKSMIFGFSARGEGIAIVLCYFLVYYLCGSLVRNEKIKYCVIYAFILTSVIIGSLVLINRFVCIIKIYA